MQGIVIVVGMAICAGVIAWALVSSSIQVKECDARGGLVVRSPSGYVCVDKNIIKEKSDAK